MKVTILDMTGNWEQDATLSDDVPLREVTVALLRELGLPERDPSGEKVSYGVCIDGQDNLLDPARTLRENNVREGTRLRLLAALIAS